jgi:hypothetical protein
VKVRESVRAGADWFVYDFSDLLLALEKPVPILAEKGAAVEAAAGAAAGSGGGSRPRKTLPGVDPEEALRAFAESVGMSVDAMWDDVTRGDGGEIVEIVWSYKDLKGTLPVGDMHMPYLRNLDLEGNSDLKGEARGVGVTVTKFTDCFCE